MDYLILSLPSAAVRPVWVYSWFTRHFLRAARRACRGGRSPDSPCRFTLCVCRAGLQHRWSVCTCRSGSCSCVLMHIVYIDANICTALNGKYCLCWRLLGITNCTSCLLSSGPNWLLALVYHQSNRGWGWHLSQWGVSPSLLLGIVFSNGERLLWGLPWSEKVCPSD